jgi:hypothetical protein
VQYITTICVPRRASGSYDNAGSDSDWRIHCVNTSSSPEPVPDSRDYAELMFDFDATYCLLKAKRIRLPLPISTLIPFTAIDNLNAFVSYTSAMSLGVAPDLLQCCLLISKQAYPKFDEQKSHSRVQELATAVQQLVQQRQQQQAQQEQEQQEQQQQTEQRLVLDCIKEVLFEQQGYTRCVTECQWTATATQTCIPCCAPLPHAPCTIPRCAYPSPCKPTSALHLPLVSPPRRGPSSTGTSAWRQH